VTLEMPGSRCRAGVVPPLPPGGGDNHLSPPPVVRHSERMTERPGARRISRPWAVIAGSGTAAHHIFELSSGVGLVFQPEFGLRGAGALWGAQIPLWMLVAARGDERWDKLLAVASGTSMAGAVVHFLLWPWRRNRWGFPVLTEAEGLEASRLPAYNAILYIWGAAAALSVLRDISATNKRWALFGLATLPLLRRSAQQTKGGC
jgi:hypothetical protein